MKCKWLYKNEFYATKHNIWMERSEAFLCILETSFLKIVKAYSSSKYCRRRRSQISSRELEHWPTKQWPFGDVFNHAFLMISEDEMRCLFETRGHTHEWTGYMYGTSRQKQTTGNVWRPLVAEGPLQWAYNTTPGRCLLWRQLFDVIHDFTSPEH